MTSRHGDVVRVTEFNLSGTASRCHGTIVFNFIRGVGQAMTVAKASRMPPLDSTAAEPFYRQIYDRFRGAIAGGVLKPGDRIPAARALSKELGLARGTIEEAYSLLAAEGYICLLYTSPGPRD